MKKIAIIGANSYIARNVYKVLCERNSTSDADGRLYEIQLYDRENEHKDGSADYIKADICKAEDFDKFDTDRDIIFLFVGKTGSLNGFNEYDSFIDANERSLLNLLSIIRSTNSKAKIVFPSTRLVYKGQHGKLSEDSEKEFKTVYAINKWACEEYLRAYQRVYGIEYAIFRICIPYGSLIQGASSYGTAEFMLKKAMNGEDITLYGDGSQRRTLTYMKDLADMLIDGAMSVECINDVYNIGGEDYSLSEMAKLIAKKHGVGVTYVDWPRDALIIESGDTVFNSDKLERIIGNRSSMKFESWIKGVN